MWVQAWKQLVSAFSRYANVRHFGVGAGLEWLVYPRVMQVLQ